MIYSTLQVEMSIHLYIEVSFDTRYVEKLSTVPPISQNFLFKPVEVSTENV